MQVQRGPVVPWVALHCPDQPVLHLPRHVVTQTSDRPEILEASPSAIQAAAKHSMSSSVHPKDMSWSLQVGRSCGLLWGSLRC